MLESPIMAKTRTLSTQDAHLKSAVAQLKRATVTTGWILIGFGVLTQSVAIVIAPVHPVAGLVYIAIGLLLVIWGDPALLAAAAGVYALSVVPTLNPDLALLGPDPIVRLIGADALLEIFTLVAVKLFLAWSAFNQFQMFRMLYGTERMTGGDPNLPVIPEMVRNRTDRLADVARIAGLIGVGLAGAALAGVFIQPDAPSVTALAEAGGALGGAALSIGLGVAFSPTDKRPQALLGALTGTLAYVAALAVLLLL